MVGGSGGHSRSAMPPIPPGNVEATASNAVFAYCSADGPYELVLTSELVPTTEGRRQDVAEMFARGKVLTARRGTVSAMGAGEMNEGDIVGPFRLEAHEPLLVAKQWVHLGEASIVVAVAAAEWFPEAYSCLALSVLCTLPFDLDLSIERHLSAVIAGIQRS